MLPPGLDAGRVRAAVLDLDGTLIDHGGRPSERSTRAIAAVEATGVRCVIATGRMFRSAQRIADLLGVTAPLVCYQGALVRDPCSGETLVHRPIGLALAREILAELGDWAASTNVYVDDELYVSNDNEPARLYAELAGVPLHVVGDLASWLAVPTTKIVTVGEPVLMMELAARMAAIFGQRAFVATSLPQLPGIRRRGCRQGERRRGGRRAARIQRRRRDRIRRRRQRPRAARVGLDRRLRR